MNQGFLNPASHIIYIYIIYTSMRKKFKKQEGVGVGGCGTLGVAPPRKAISDRRCVLHVRCEIVLVVVVVQSAKRAGALVHSYLAT